jgi:hypothetical protein
VRTMALPAQNAPSQREPSGDGGRRPRGVAQPLRTYLGRNLAPVVE